MRRVIVDYRQGGFGQVLSSLLEGVVADGLTLPFHFGSARHASPWLLLDAKKLSSRPAKPPLLEAESEPRLEFAALGNSRGQACYVAALSPPRHSGLLEGSG